MLVLREGFEPSHALRGSRAYKTRAFTIKLPEHIKSIYFLDYTLVYHIQSILSRGKVLEFHNI